MDSDKERPKSCLRSRNGRQALRCEFLLFYLGGKAIGSRRRSGHSRLLPLCSALQSVRVYYDAFVHTFTILSPSKKEYFILKILKRNKNLFKHLTGFFPFSITWDPKGAKCSKRYPKFELFQTSPHFFSMKFGTRGQ